MSAGASLEEVTLYVGRQELLPASDRFLVCHECDYVALKAPHLSSLGGRLSEWKIFAKSHLGVTPVKWTAEGLRLTPLSSGSFRS